ncbi:hypothetical protein PHOOPHIGHTERS_35 [Serratia phage vB_SmaS_PhooPhighters]|uniref:Uncharacterized protein n=1 Tax=Serratia phage vB_SmaS_Rovert TaxID=2777363 RepID=A0A7T3TKX6_9CAUD|nr:hypothetical protein QJS24_gp28 [Serratia phage vB_SmaS_Rovert]QPX74996.1 hypothetical protein [Serratia phage vB_SmaS_Rovert]UGO51969.1 hypothetical protein PHOOPHIGHTERS_35 [Serratia phage vB_SmaS_PhooPhighters]
MGKETFYQLQARKAGENNSPIYEFFVYRIYRLRNSEQFKLRTWRVYSTGHLLAKHAATQSKDDIGDLMTGCKVVTFFMSSKRKEIMAVSGKSFGDIEYLGEMDLKKDHAMYFQNNQQIGV